MESEEQELIKQQQLIEKKLIKLKREKAEGRIELQTMKANGLCIKYPHGNRITQKRLAKICRAVELVEEVTYQKAHTIFLNPSTIKEDTVWNVVIQLIQ